ncbi:TPA: DUF2285 domain-containing protein [Pseudomonas aeruginosa]|jgi:hypothetical protein|uniref:DUF2285 domain-containing protein n=1 Tax=Stutzerimonas stutzeri TaxID=316 RepID=A0AA40RQN3_STUST|nr:MULTISPECIES: DUF2285 domain-containing protein [Pseudomonadaceae]ELR9005292.1 DUF2285 domain-containing protein [Salmonella enterica]HBO0181953.1 DUF2285 domain-containing protein [Pseudomonas aeruginosa]EZO30824.1 hypothetical protein AJ61_04407 [Pseudomonas aeruginosa 3574]MBA1302883.1 DUF2285 domain-containing protein [Stutzerimonas stutzeri]MPT21027.1 DUF2285 domain-containing protein [Pseudomonas sp.]
MVEPADHWHPGAAYLYILHLDGPALAWEYLRRHPDYRHDWLRRRRHPKAAQRWGLRLLEDPALDARDAHPAWFPDHDSVVQLHPDDDPPPGAVAFDFWHLPGTKSLLHDGRRLVLLTRWPGRHVRLALASGLAHGMAHSYAVRATAQPYSRCHALAGELDKLAVAASAAVHPRPAATALLEMHTLQALDGSLAGASLRRVADVLFGTETIHQDWHADGALRARVRRLVRRGQWLMRGGYRHLAQLPTLEQGRSAARAKRP